MSQDQEPIGADPPTPDTVEGSEKEPMNALETSQSEVEEVQEEPEDEALEAKEDDDTQPSQESDAEGLAKTDEDDDAHPMDALLEEESYDLEMPRRGEIRVGTVARVTETDVLVDVGAKSEGVIPARELERLTEEQRSDLVVGKEVEVYVLRSGGRDGHLLLSVSRAKEEQDWREAEALLENQDLFEGTVSGYNKGGLIIKLGHLRGFIPASQVSLSRRRRAHGSTPDQRWGKMVSEPVIAKVIEVDRRRNRLIMSERAATREARDALKERLISELEPGETRTGHVISLADFGAFVDIGGADGLVHLSEISWKRIAHPREVLKVGQKIEVKVLGVDQDRKRISLSIRELEANPWDQIVEKFQEGQLVEGTITKLTKFGAFASLAGTEDFDIEGLIHVSELADRRIEHPREVVQEGQVVALRVIKIDNNRRRIGLSLKRVSSEEYSEQDWRIAMQDLQSLDAEGISVSVQGEEVEDFDAALDDVIDEVPERVETEEPAEVSELPVDEGETTQAEDADELDTDVEASASEQEGDEDVRIDEDEETDEAVTDEVSGHVDEATPSSTDEDGSDVEEKTLPDDSGGGAVEAM